jgi:hypothetical protein
MRDFGDFALASARLYLIILDKQNSSQLTTQLIVVIRPS